MTRAPWEPFAQRTPCGDCPFRRVGGIRLRPKRAEEIAGEMTSAAGGSFPCHKTVDYGTGYGDKRAGGMRPPEIHCAGALIFAEKNGVGTSSMRLAERLGLYDRTRLDMAADVFDTPDEMIDTNRRSDG